MSPIQSPSTCRGTGRPSAETMRASVRPPQPSTRAVARDAQAVGEQAHGDGRDVDQGRAVQDDAGQAAVVEPPALGDVDGLVLEVGVGVGVLHDRRHPGDDRAADVGLEPRRAHEVLLAERRDGGGREVPLLVARLALRVGVAAPHDGGVEADARGERVVPAVDARQVDPARAPVVGDAQEVLGGVHDLARDARASSRRRSWPRRAGRSAAVSEPARPLAASLTVPSPPKETTTS